MAWLEPRLPAKTFFYDGPRDQPQPATALPGLIVFSKSLKDENSFVSPNINLQLDEGGMFENNGSVLCHVIPC